jgi:hypothetical protein
MFEKLAKFRLVKPRRRVPWLREAMPAIDNLQGFLRPERQRRIPSPVLVCHWSLIDDGTRLGCRWQPEALAETAPAESNSELTNSQTSQSQAKRLGRRRKLPNAILTVGARSGRPSKMRDVGAPLAVFGWRAESYATR